MEWKCGARCTICLTFDFDVDASTIKAFPLPETEPVDNAKL